MTFTPSPTRTASRTQTPVKPSATPDLRTSRGVVQAAFAAYLARDETRLRELYSDYGEGFCAFFTQTMIACISYPYIGKGLGSLLEWWVEPPEAPLTPIGDIVFLYSRWSNSDETWSQLFSLEKQGNQWLIQDNSTELYPSDRTH